MNWPRALEHDLLQKLGMILGRGRREAPSTTEGSAEQISAEQISAEQISAEQISAEQISAELIARLVPVARNPWS